jgi:PilZ domain
LDFEIVWLNNLGNFSFWNLAMLERRRYLRTPVFKSAKLIAPGRSMIGCIVRDLSTHGACLHLSSSTDLPAEFDLSFDTGHMKRKCRIAWQTLTKVGVSFEQPTEQ